MLRVLMRWLVFQQVGDLARGCKCKLRTRNFAAFEHVLFECQQLLHNMKLRGVVRRRRDHLRELLMQGVGNRENLCRARVMRHDVLESLQRARRRRVLHHRVMAGALGGVMTDRAAERSRRCHCDRADEWYCWKRNQHPAAAATTAG